MQQLIFSLTLLFWFSACRQYLATEPSEDTLTQSPQKMTDLQAPLHFSFNSFLEDTLGVSLRDGTGVSYKHALIDVYDQEQKKMFSMVTDQNGEAQKAWSFLREDSVIYLKVLAPGFPQESFSVPLKFPLESVVLTTSGPRPASQKRAVRNLSLTSLLPGQVEDRAISSTLLSDINTAFPERQKIMDSHPEYLLPGNASELTILDSADLFITFIHEGAGYRNSFGYYSYPIDNPPSSAADLELHPVFPNASYQGSGGELYTGQTIKVGPFSQNTKVGFFIVANGWNGSNINFNQPNYFSNSSFNPENEIQWRQHLAILYHPEYENIILGFEDINRENSGCDHDFNDLIITAAWNPIENVAINQIIEIPGETDSDSDGLPDNIDDYPQDPERASTIFFPAENEEAIIAFEDLYPSMGDYDFNDVVISYQIQEIRNAKQKVKEIVATYTPLASGATINNGFAIFLENPNIVIDSLTVFINDKVLNRNIAETTSEGVLLNLIPSIFAFFDDVEGRMINTKNSKLYAPPTPIQFKIVFETPIDLPFPPYNPFIFRVTDPSIEVHLADQNPSPNFNVNLFGQEDDASQPNSGITFRNANNLPWALHTSSAWLHPYEQVDLLQAYPDFSSWVLSDGRNSVNWSSKNRVEEHLYKSGN